MSKAQSYQSTDWVMKFLRPLVAGNIVKAGIEKAIDCFNPFLSLETKAI